MSCQTKSSRRKEKRDDIEVTQAKIGQHLHVLVARADRSVSPRAQLLCEVTWQAHSHVGDADAEV